MLLPNIRVYGFRTFSSHTYSLFPICYNLTISPSKFSSGIQNSSSIEYTRNLDTKKTFSVKSIALRNIHHVSYVSLHTRSNWDSSRFFKHSVAIKEPMSFEYTCEAFTRYWAAWLKITTNITEKSSNLGSQITYNITVITKWI